MKTCIKIFLSLLLFCPNYLLAQQLSIDSNAFKSWSQLGEPAISNDGRFFSCNINNEPVGSSSLFIKEINGELKIKIPGVKQARFTQDSKEIFFLKGKDSLEKVDLLNGSTSFINNTSSFDLAGEEQNEFLIYKSSQTSLILTNLITREEIQFEGVQNYILGKTSKTLLLLHLFEKDGQKLDSIEWVSLPTLNRSIIYKGTIPSNFTFDKDDRQLCFLVKDAKSDRDGNELWYYDAGSAWATKLVSDQNSLVDSSLLISFISRFSTDGRSIFFTYKKQKQNSKKVTGVDVYSYFDAKLQSQQLEELDPSNWRAPSETYAAIVKIAAGKVIRLTYENEQLQDSRPIVGDGLVKLVIQNGEGSHEESSWNKESKRTFSLVSTVDGTKKELGGTARKIWAYMSPEGKYVIYDDADSNNFFSYEISSGITRNLTAEIRVIKSEGTDPSPIKSERDRKSLNPAGFVEDDKGILLYAGYDVYEVSLNGAFPPINLTNGYGQRHNIEFKLADNPNTTFKSNERILLSAFDKTNKKNGFYATSLGQQKEPELLSMQPCMFEGSDQYIFKFRPLKAKNVSAYIVRRENSNESPNYFSTTDFKSFQTLTDLHPEKEYNWLTTELITWKTFDGSTSQGVLYKPENFDPKKKYPIIFYYYEKLSDNLHKFIEPEYSIGPLNIPEYVSNGYLVFTPDIHYKVGNPGKSAYNSVVSAAMYLSKMPWVDTKRMGLQGHSFGGYETYYIVTHSHLFAAAQAGEGLTDFISEMGDMGADGDAMHDFVQTGQYRMGSLLWEHPELYIHNSPIFFANYVTTPLLIMDNKNDDAVRFNQGFEMFTALRRLGKKAWMLQYDGYGHTVYGIASKDFTIRMRQFFDYYLKDIPAPKWMVEGIPAIDKGILNGLELEPPGVKPGPGLLIKRDHSNHSKIDSAKNTNLVKRLP